MTGVRTDALRLALVGLDADLALIDPEAESSLLYAVNGTARDPWLERMCDLGTDTWSTVGNLPRGTIDAFGVVVACPAYQFRPPEGLIADLVGVLREHGIPAPAMRPGIERMFDAFVDSAPPGYLPYSAASRSIVAVCSDGQVGWLVHVNGEAEPKYEPRAPGGIVQLLASLLSQSRVTSGIHREVRKTPIPPTKGGPMPEEQDQQQEATELENEDSGGHTINTDPDAEPGSPGVKGGIEVPGQGEAAEKVAEEGEGDEEEEEEEEEGEEEGEATGQ